MEVKPVLDDLEVVESTLAKESTDDHQDPLGGGFKYFLFSPLLGEDSHLD